MGKNIKQKELERRSYDFDVSADIEEGHVVGLAVVYGQRANIGGCFDEIIEPGALDNTDLKDVRFLVNHDFSRIPLARSRNNNGNSTLKLTVDERGLLIDAELDIEHNKDAEALHSAVRRGDISGMSFGFIVGDEEWDDLDTDHPTRHILSLISIIEVSAVTFPAYDDTEIKTRGSETLENARLALDSARETRDDSLESELELLKSKVKLLTGGSNYET